MKKIPISTFRHQILLFLITLPFAILPFFAYPAADDYCIADFVCQNGFLKSQFLLFQQMNGRYLSTFLISVFNLHTIWLYRTGLLIVIILFYASLIFAAKQIHSNFRNITFISSIAFLIFFNISPQIAEIVYWLPGSITYLLTVSALIVLFANQLKIITHCNNHYLLQTVLLLIIGGLHELGLIAALMFFIWYVLFLRLNKKQKKQTVFLIVISLIILVITTFWGAGLERMSYFEQILLSERIISGLVSSLKFHLLIFSNLPFLLSFLWVFILIRPLDTPNLKLRRPLLSFLFICSAFCFLVTIHPLATGFAPPLRIYSFLSILYIPAILLHVLQLKANLPEYFTLSLQKRKQFPTIFFILFLISLSTGIHRDPDGNYVYTSNVFSAFRDIFTKVVPYSKEMNERIDKTIHAAETGQDTLIISPLKNKPRSLYFLDISKQNPDWIGLCYKNYYKYHGVLIVRDTLH